MQISDEERSELEALRIDAVDAPRDGPALEEILYQPLPVLDHGFVRVDA